MATGGWTPLRTIDDVLYITAGQIFRHWPACGSQFSGIRYAYRFFFLLSRHHRFIILIEFLSIPSIDLLKSQQHCQYLPSLCPFPKTSHNARARLKVHSRYRVGHLVGVFDLSALLAPVLVSSQLQKTRVRLYTCHQVQVMDLLDPSPIDLLHPDLQLRPAKRTLLHRLSQLPKEK